MAKNTYDTPLGELPRCTGILAILNKPFLKNWYIKTAREETIRAVWEFLSNHGNVAWLAKDPQGTLTEEVIMNATCHKSVLIETVTHSVKEHERISKKALDEGSFCHGAIESYEKEWDEEPREQSFINFIQEYYPQYPNAPLMLQMYFHIKREHKIEVIASEMTVWHSIGYAGTLDMVAMVDGELAIVDLKTTKSEKLKSGKIKKFPTPFEYYLQVSAYQTAYNEMTGKNIKKRFVLFLDKINPEASELVDLDKPKNRQKKDWKSFQNCLELYNAQKEK